MPGIGVGILVWVRTGREPSHDVLTSLSKMKYKAVLACYQVSCVPSDEVEVDQR